MAGIQSFEKQTKPQALLKNISDVSTLVDLCTTKESGQLAAVTNVCHSGPPRVAAIPAEEDALGGQHAVLPRPLLANRLGPPH